MATVFRQSKTLVSIAGALFVAAPMVTGFAAQDAHAEDLPPTAVAANPPTAPAGPAPKAITLGEALAYSHSHQPLIRGALARLAAQKSAARIPRAAWFPQVGATAQIFVGTANNTTGSYLNVPEVDLPRIGATRSLSGENLVPSGSTLLAASITQEVFDFGKISSQIAAADALIGLEAARADIIDLDVALAVEESFDSVLASHAVLSAAEDSFKRAAAHRDFASAGVKSGLRPAIDLTRAEADLAQAEVRRVRARSGLERAQAGLAAAIAWDAPSVDAEIPTSEEGSKAPSPGLAEALKMALEKNPAVAAGLARIRAQLATTRAIGRELLPNLFASATVSSRAGGAQPSSLNPADVPTGAGFLPYVVNWDIGAVLQWNIFDATVLARRRTSEAREEEARADLDVAKNNIGLSVERAYLDLDAAQRVIPGLVAAVEAGRANQDQADVRFRAGLGTIIELVDAEALLTTADVELAIGRFAADRARAALARAIGAASGKGNK